VTAPHVTLNLEGHTITGVWTKSASGLPGVPISLYEIGILIEPKAVGTKVQSTVPGAAVDNFTYGIQDQADRAVITGPGLLVDDNDDGYASLSVMKGDYYLRVAVIPAGVAPPSLKDEEKLAKAILPKL
jgi:hypothetical protein